MIKCRLQPTYASLDEKSHLRTLAMLTVILALLFLVPLSSDAKEFSSPAGDEADNALPQILSLVELTPSQLEAAIIKTSNAVEKPFSRSITLTGKVALNEEKLAHIFPIVSGQVEAVDVSLGDIVREGQVLLRVHSREVGTAKLDLYQAKLQLELANLKLNLQNELTKNTEELLDSLRKRENISDVQKKFAGRSMGNYRERLLQAYSALVKSEADVQRLEGVAKSGAISSKQLLAANASRNADSATFFARLEQIDFELRTSRLEVSQVVREAETHVAVATTNLEIMGCERKDLEDIDPASQGQAVSDYFIRAPFGGTVISKDVVLREQIRPDTQIMAIADTSTVWIEANVYEKDAPLLDSLKDCPVIFRNTAWPDREFEAKIFFTGEIMDEKTRTISMRAVADNRNRLLKPGMFVTIEFNSQGDDRPVIQVPAGAVMEYAGKPFVFVRVSDRTFERREIEVGESNGSTTVVKKGINKSDNVVTSGSFVLKSVMLEDMMGRE